MEDEIKIENELNEPSIFDEAISSMPKPSETVDDTKSDETKSSNIGIVNSETKTEPETKPKDSDEWRDIEGLTFDADIHESPPQINSKGYLKRKRGAKKKSVEKKLHKQKARENIETNAGNSKIGGIPNKEIPEDIAAEVVDELSKEEFERHAAATVLNLETCGLMFLGADAKMEPEVKKNMIHAYAECYQEYGIIKTPPWIAAAATTAAWIVPVTMKPEPKTRLEGYKIKMGTWWYKFKNRKSKKSDFAPEKEETKKDSE